MRVPLQDLTGLSLGIEFFVAIVGLTAVGHRVDGKLGTAPWFTLLGFGLGAAVGFRSMYRFATKPPGDDSGNGPGTPPGNNP